MSTPPIEPDSPGQISAREFWTPGNIGLAARSGALLAVVGASIAMFAFEVAGRVGALDSFTSANKLPLARRHRMLVAMALTGASFAAVAWASLLRRRRAAALELLRKVSLLISPLAVIGLVVPLFRLHAWERDPVTLCCGLTIAAIVLEISLSRSLQEVPERLASKVSCLWTRLTRWFPCWGGLSVVLVGVVAFSIFVSYFCIRHHLRLGTAAFDLGGYDNIFYNALDRHPLRGTVAVPSGEDWSSLRTHAEFSVYMFLPFYAIRPRAETLLCIQALVVGLGAVPVYLFAVRRIPRFGAFVLAISYLLYAPIHAGTFYDFHFQPLASTLILWCFYFLDTKKNLLFALFFVVALGCREDVSISLAVAGAMMLFGGFRPALGISVAVISTAYFLVVRSVVMPHFGSWWFTDMYKDLIPEGDKGFQGVVKTMLSNPLFLLSTLLTREKILHILKIFLPLAFLPMRKPALWFGFVPAILGTILTTGYGPTVDTTFQYVFYWVPFIFVGAALVLDQIASKSGKAAQAAAVLTLAFTTVATSFHWGVVFQRTHFASAWGPIDLEPLTQAERQNLSDLKELGSKIPPHATVSMSEAEVPHFSNRLTIYALRAAGANDAEYVLYRKDTGRHGATQATEALATGKYERIASKGNFILLKFRSPSASQPEAKDGS